MPIRLEARLCLEREDDAAELLIGSLRNPDTRWEALTAVQRYRRPPLLGIFDATLRRRWDALMAREDVQTEIEQHGRVLNLELYAPPS